MFYYELSIEQQDCTLFAEQKSCTKEQNVNSDIAALNIETSSISK